MTGTEKKKKFIINIVYTVILIALFYLFFKFAFGTILPIICAIVAAMILQKPVNFICKKTPLKRGLVSALSVLFAFAVVISGIVLILIWVGSEFKGFFQYIMIEFEDMPALIHKIEGYIANAIGFLPEKLESTVMDFISEKLATLTAPTVTPNEPSASIDLSMLSTPLKGIWNTAKQIPTTLVSIVVAIVACCFMTADFASVKKLVLGFFQPDTRTKIVRAKRLLFPSLGKMAKAYGIIITITFCELSLGLFLLKLMGIYDSGYIFVIAILTAIIDIVPVLGTGTVLIPWAVISLLNANYPLAIGLIVMYACITVIRQIIEPKLVAAQLGIPAFLTIVSMFIGSQIFGVIGIFILPITIVMLKLLNDEGIIHIFHYTDEEDETKTEDKSDKNITEKAEVSQKND
ncbi:MAG: sporulation integral membrane protein YtvI [Clostridia bacterium]|nr:sporulation integral membrane protein YtvI [Clostridia bacterium]